MSIIAELLFSLAIAALAMGLAGVVLLAAEWTYRRVVGRR